jgi:hypothetical protein
MPNPQPQAPHQPTRHPSRAHSTNLTAWPTSLALSLAPGGLSACLGVHRSSVPRAGQTARPGIQEGSTMTEAAVSFAGNLTDQPEVRYTEGGIARAMFRVAVSGRRDQEASFFTWSCSGTRPSMPPSHCRRGAGSWSWAGSSSGAGPPRTTTPNRSWRWWPRSWGRACGGRRRPRPGRRAASASSQRHLRQRCALDDPSEASVAAWRFRQAM